MGEVATGRRAATIDVYLVKVAISVVIYCLSVSAVPIYNKQVFSGGANSHGLGLKKFPYPIATAFLQLGLVAAVLVFANIFGHFAACGHSASGASWLFGPHFFYKVRHVAPVGVLFGLKYGLTNWGLQLMPTGTHLLLQSTDLVWTVLTARVWNKEKLGFVELFAAGLATMGSLMIGLHAGQILEAPLLPLLVNCLTPLVLALCISTLRSGAKELFRADNPLQGSVTPTEFTSLKLLMSSAMALILSLLMENGLFSLTKQESHREAWWVAIQQQQHDGIAFLLLGGVFVLIFQVNITWLAGLTSAVTVGIVGGIKVVPQWLLNAAFLGLNVDLSLLNIGGAMLVLTASCLYARSVSRPHMLVLGCHGLEWQPRLREAGQSPGSEASSVPASEDLQADLLGVKRKPSMSADSVLLTPSAKLDVSVFLKERLPSPVSRRPSSR